MNHRAQTAPETTLGGLSDKVRPINWERAGIFYARIALGAAFLSAVASRFGFWDRTVDLKHFANFIQYAAEVTRSCQRPSFRSWRGRPRWPKHRAESYSYWDCGRGGFRSRAPFCLPCLEPQWRFLSGSNRRWIIRFSLLQARLPCWRCTPAGRAANRLSTTEWAQSS